MKIKNLAIIILMTTFFIILGTKAYATTGIINEKTVKLRKQPDSKTVLDYVYKGDEVEILELENGWYKVKAKTELGKVTGYISAKEVDVEDKNSNTPADKTEEKPQVETPNDMPEETPVDIMQEPEETTPVVSPEIETEQVEENKQYTLEKEVSVKALPLINSREKAKISGNIRIIESINEWSRIESDIEIGWIRTNTLKKSLTKVQTPDVQQEPEKQQEETITEQPNEKIPEDTKVPENEPQPETTKMNKTGYVSTDGLRVRKGPSTDTEEITSLSKNDKVEITGQTGKWYQIKLDGETGYVSAKYISDTKVHETTSRSGSTLRNEEQTPVVEPTTEVLEQPKVEEKQPIQETPKVEEPVKETNQSTKGEEIVAYAKQYLGYKYKSGGTSPASGFDCSGYTQYVYKHFGISINRTSGAQINNGVAVQRSDLQPGDLVIFNNDANTKIGHVGIYVGNGNFIHASNPSDGVKITTLTSGYYHKRYVGARRVY